MAKKNETNKICPLCGSDLVNKGIRRNGKPYLCEKNIGGCQKTISESEAISESDRDKYRTELINDKIRVNVEDAIAEFEEQINTQYNILIDKINRELEIVERLGSNKPFNFKSDSSKNRYQNEIRQTNDDENEIRSKAEILSNDIKEKRDKLKSNFPNLKSKDGWKF